MTIMLLIYARIRAASLRQEKQLSEEHTQAKPKVS